MQTGALPDRSWLADVPVLHDSTSPAAIVRRQRRDVRAAQTQLGPDATVAAISVACCLPVWSVVRLLGRWTWPVLVKPRGSRWPKRAGRPLGG